MIASRRFQELDDLMNHRVFFAPLTETDITDNVSGISAVPYSANTMVWDNVMNMWRFTYTVSTIGTHGAGRFSGLPIVFSDSSVNGVSMLMEVSVSNTSAVYIRNDYLASAFANIPTTTINTLYKIAHILTPFINNERFLKIYIAGVEKYSGRYTTPFAVNFPLTWTAINTGTLLNSVVHMKNLMIFDKALTIDEFKKIQNI
jgi:hypothetical protein